MRLSLVNSEAVKLGSAEILFDKVTVTGTENLLMAATLAEGTTILKNAAREPEVMDLVSLLKSMGARIKGEGTDTLTIQGVASLHGCEHHIVPDRIEMGTYVCAAAITGGSVRITRCEPTHLTAFLDRIEEAGLPLKRGETEVEVFPHQGLRALDIQTKPFPGFPTDMQAQYMAVMTQAKGRAIISENIFENRFMHVQELLRMGAIIKIDGHTAVTTGPCTLSGAEVMATDLRASASLVLAALVADGETHVCRIYHLDRGYENLEGKLKSLGANVKRLSGS